MKEFKGWTDEKMIGIKIFIRGRFQCTNRKGGKKIRRGGSEMEEKKERENLTSRL